MKKQQQRNAIGTQYSQNSLAYLHNTNTYMYFYVASHAPRV